MSVTFGAMFRRERPPEDLTSFARSVEAAGLDELWIVEDCFWAAGPSAVTAALAVTDRLHVGLGIAPVVVRNPAIAAMEISGIARLFPGRFIAGFGHGVDEWMQQIGALPASQLTAFDESVDAIRRLIDGEPVTVNGRFVHLTDVQLVFPPSVPPVILAGVTGPKSIDIAASVADGLLLPEGSSPGYVAAANRRQGRGRACVVYVLFAVDDDRDVARAVVAAAVERFAGREGDARLALLGEPAGDRGVDIDRISRFAVAGTPDDCAAAVDALVAAGATSVVVVPHGDDHDQQIRRLVDEVLPLVGC